MANDTEFTLSTGKLLAIFFGMVAICGVFFSLGYAVGKGSSQSANGAITDSSELSALNATGGAKPSPGKSGNSGSTAANPAPASPAPETTVPAATDASKAQATDTTTNPPPTKPADTPPATSPDPAATATGFMVQVAAVSKKEDAEALVNALRKKQYPVLLVTDPTGAGLFRVQVGPFSLQKDAEAMRTKLAADGYNAILKK